MKIEGIITPILTPMNSDESVNYDKLEEFVEMQIEGGVHGIFCFGTNGESYILSDDEKLKILEKVVKVTNKRVPVFAGTGQPGTLHTIELSKKAKGLGVDALSIISPFFAAPSQDDIYNHYYRIAKEVDLPIIVYNIPARTGTNISPLTIKRLSEIENIVGVKDSSGNFDNMLQYIEQTRESNKKRNSDFVVLSGNDSLILWCLYAGGAGAISGVANVYPRNMVSIYENFIKKETDKAKAAQDSIRSFRDVFKYGNPNTVVKTAVNLLGFDVGPCRSPFNSISEEGLKQLKTVLEENKNLNLN
ncbi:MAG: 4-hydroxy-tetrahydrodipicolinate synthase [Sphaerochaetaceae bacterium]|jgi:4-hydroxy-tetrahydrodipicolinate synthase